MDTAATHVPRDEATIDYFDSHVPEYSVERFDRAVDFIRRTAQPGSALIDIGCGTGNTVEYLREATPIAEMAGLDVSARSLELLRERVPGCETYEGSILDPVLLSSIEKRFDFAVLGAILHHLIAPTRTRSRRLAEQAMQNTLGLLKPGGHVIVIEPVYYPSLAMDVLFYVKKAVSAVNGGRRVPI